MARSLVALWLTLIAAIVTISCLALLWIRQREQNTRQRVRDVLTAQLVPINDSISTVIEEYSIRLRRELAERDFGNLDDCVQVTRSPLSHALVVVDKESQLYFPTNIGRESTDRRSLIDEALQLLREQANPQSKPTPQNVAQGKTGAQQQKTFDNNPLRSRSYQGLGNRSETLQETQSTDQNFKSSDSLSISTKTEMETSDTQAGGENYGWITWYHRRNMILGFWWDQAEEWRAIVVLPSARWMADIVAALPDTRPHGKLGLAKSIGSDNLGFRGSVNQLVDVEGHLIYQWGNAPTDQWESIQDAEPAAELPVANPLEGWRLRVYASESLLQQLAGDDLFAPIWLAVGAIATALVLCGVLVTVTLNRQMRLATNRVSFVNQVSHELRTPLTNICMYADLLASQIEMQDGSPQQLERIGVIQDESRRLSRLIGNVLEFASSGSKSEQSRRSHRVLDDLVRDVLATFRPRLDELGFEVVVDLQLSEPRWIDADAVEQILVNLIGNAEKYAAEGKRLEVSTSGTATHSEIHIRDHGPGVPARLASKVFEPFERLSDRLEDPAGTGIGLTIARELARKHGGDCMLIDSRQGAAFRCLLEAPLTNEEE